MEMSSIALQSCLNDSPPLPAMQQYLDPYKEQREQAKKRALFLKKSLGRTLELNEFEQVSNPRWGHECCGGHEGLRDTGMMCLKSLHHTKGEILVNTK